MKNLLVLAVIGTLAWIGYREYTIRSGTFAEADPVTPSAGPRTSTIDTPIETLDDAPSFPPWASPQEQAPSQFSCDGRTHCSQMRSCDEATYFIQNCPDTTMDGDHDGVPCERQWCG